jgi:hypothetical protein
MLRLLIDENFDQRILRGLKLEIPNVNYVVVQETKQKGSPRPTLACMGRPRINASFTSIGPGSFTYPLISLFLHTVSFVCEIVHNLTIKGPLSAFGLAFVPQIVGVAMQQQAVLVN